MSSSKVRVAKTAEQKQPVAKCACGGSCKGSKAEPSRIDPKDPSKLLSEVTECMVCQDANVKKRGLCSACYRQCNRMVLMSETTWVELSLAGCCISDLNDKNHMRRSMITERIVEYRRGRN